MMEDELCGDYGVIKVVLWKTEIVFFFFLKEFNIKDSEVGSIYPMWYYLDYPDNVKLLEDYTSQALKKYNKENGTTYEFDKIIKVNGEGCRDRIYYITLSVKNGKEKYFQVKMVTRLLRKSLKFPSSGQPR
ncbi:putative protein isoform X2 [Capsicum annuum]|nr:uncharacterized protein LOC124886430 isoform X2 [Capsicum annuum]